MTAFCPVCVGDHSGIGGPWQLCPAHLAELTPEPADRHVLSCAVWASPDPEVPCDCGALDEVAAAYRGEVSP